MPACPAVGCDRYAGHCAQAPPRLRCNAGVRPAAGAPMVKLVDTADLKSAAFLKRGVPVRPRLGAPRRACSMFFGGRIGVQSGGVDAPGAPHGPAPMQAAGACNRPISLQPCGQVPCRAVCDVAALANSRAIGCAPRLAAHPGKVLVRPRKEPEQVLSRFAASLPRSCTAARCGQGARRRPAGKAVFYGVRWCGARPLRVPRPGS